MPLSYVIVTLLLVVPNGGDGGKGGDVIFTATTRYTTLSSLRTRPLWQANNGVPGKSRCMAGAKRGVVRDFRSGRNSNFQC